MEWLYLACIVLSGAALVVITLIIPLGVFMRYIMNNPLAWPEPASVIMMVMFSFLGGAAVYRANVHIAVEALLNAVSPPQRRAMLWGVDACMGTTALFMLVYGVQLCLVTRFQTMAEFPSGEDIDPARPSINQHQAKTLAGIRANAMQSKPDSR